MEEGDAGAMAPDNSADALRTEVQRLRREIGERDDLLAFIAHELRNPMHTLSLQVASIRSLALAGRTSELVDRTIKTQATVARYLDRATVLLELARRHSNAYPVSFRRVDLASLLRRWIDSVRPEADYHGVALRVDAAGTCAVDTDPLALEHVVGNLLGNAFKHAHAKRIDISLRAREGCAEIDVVDDGRGIAAADQTRVFAKFERGAEALRPGSGLGLWIVSQLMEALGGTISLDSSAGAGCRFSLRIPLTRSELAEHP